MRRFLSLPGLTFAVWIAYLAFVGLLSVMLAVRSWHPHFLPVVTMLALVMVAGLALIIGSTWRIVRGPERRRALACRLIGTAPLWFLAGYFLYGLALGSGRKVPLTPAVKMLAPLAESVMDLEARFRYPQRTAGEKVVMISEPMPEAEARAQVAAMDRHIRALEARLGRPTAGTVHWARGPLLIMDSHAIIGLCMGSRPGEAPADAEGLAGVDRHEVAHCVLTSHCTAWFDPPTVLTEGWAQANQGDDPIDQAFHLRESWARGSGLTLRQLTGPDWYDRHEWAAYTHGAALVDFLLRRFGPETFLELYATCRQATFESDCRRVLGLDLDGLDAAFRADIDRLVDGAGSHDRHWLERRPLGPGVAAASWKAFLDDYFAAAERLRAPYRHVRLTAAWSGSSAEADGRTHSETFEIHLLRSGPFASLRRRDLGELAYLAHPRRSILARLPHDPPWELEPSSGRTPEQSYHRALDRIADFDVVEGEFASPLIALAREHADFGFPEDLTVTALDHFEEGGRPRVRVRIVDPSAIRRGPWRTATYVLAADDLYAIQTEQTDDVGRDGGSHRSEFAYDRHEGIPVLRSVRSAGGPPGRPQGTTEWKVIERRFGPIPEEEFDPDRFLAGTRVTVAPPDPIADDPTLLARWYWVPFPIGALSLVCGVALALGRRRTRGGPAPDPVANDEASLASTSRGPR
jgi:hypothetical protein